MRFTVSLDLALSRERVLELLTRPEHRPQWLRGLVLHEPLHGEDGHVGTASRVVMGSGKQRMEAVETITRREPTELRGVPSHVDVRFEREIAAPGMWSAARERLIEVDPGRTRWESENEYRFTGAMRLLAPCMRRSFIAQAQQHMRDFQAFAEHGVDVREAGR
ncbi:SRPBCC family protein [Agrococcus sp. 1P02AA]|uniref:SRPBCC family protein n=1 Tax=Agrococcus sp. 1P02AA TaxID=3132259 RepID=UPI0039A5A854